MAYKMLFILVAGSLIALHLYSNATSVIETSAQKYED